MSAFGITILCWLSVSAGFFLGAAWCGLFRTPGEPAERQDNEG